MGAINPQLLNRFLVNAKAIQNDTPANIASTATRRTGSSGQRSKNIGRTKSTATDSGSQSAITRTNAGSCSRGKKMPERNIMGVRNRVK